MQHGSQTKRSPRDEPLYDTDRRTGASVEVFYADRVLAKSFGTRPGWFWWSCRRGSLPQDRPTGPFASKYVAYRNVASFGTPTLRDASFGGRRRDPPTRDTTTAP